MQKLGMLSLFFILAALVCAAANTPQSAAKVADNSISMVEREVVPLAEAMPADKYAFAPSSGEFKGVRTFGQQMTHIATVIYEVAAAMLSEKAPVDLGTNENGAASLQSKDAAVKYLKDAFAYAHKAMATLTDKNMFEQIKSPFGNETAARMSLAAVPVWHTYDHYGQAVVYARMNGVIPPASR